MNIFEEKFKSGLKCFEQGDYIGSLEIMEDINSHFPNHPGILLLMVQNFYFLERYNEAEEKLSLLIKLHGEDSEYVALLAHIQKKLNKKKTAVENYLKAIELNPESAESHYNLGIIYFEEKKINEAALEFEKAVNLKTDFYQAYYNLGNSYREMKEFKKSEEAYKSAIKITPDFEDAIYNMGVVQENLLKFDEALASYNFVLRMNNNNVEARWNRSLLRLLQGNYSEGFKEYECRLEKPGFKRYNRVDKKWNGEPVEGKRILVYSEQGFGDAIQFSRFLKYLKPYKAKIVFETRPELVSLLSGVEGVDEIISREEKIENDCDYEVPLLSLPHILNLEKENFLIDKPYIFPDPGISKKVTTSLADNGKFRIGIVWRGNPNHIRDNERSVDISFFKTLNGLENVELVSLQKGIDEKIIERDLSGTEIKRKGENFDEIASIIEQLDLVISVDTAIAHLAGAMLKPVWTLIPAYPDWRWGLEGSKTIWYPTMKLFRQKERGVWEEVFENIKAELSLIESQNFQRVN